MYSFLSSDSLYANADWSTVIPTETKNNVAITAKIPFLRFSLEILRPIKAKFL